MHKRGIWVRWSVAYLAALVLLLWTVPAQGAPPPMLTVVTPNPVSSGQMLEVTGSGFTTGQAALFYLDASVSSFAMLEVDASGNINGSTARPGGLDNGPSILTACRVSTAPCPATDAAQHTLEVGPPPSFTSITPSPVAAGGVLTVTGAGFAPSHTIGLFVDTVTSP